jgi:hypothetical protein
MAIGTWLVADLTGSGRQDLVHVVSGTDYVNIWISNGGGGFAVGSFSPWPGYDMAIGTWLVADLTGSRRQDLVHVVSGTDYVNTWNPQILQNPC